MSIKLKKTITIGLGGTGRDAVLQMKEKLFDNYGEIPPMMKFLVIDTIMQPRDGLDVSLAPGEFVRLVVNNPKTAIKASREIKDWKPDDIPNFALSTVPRQIRALGRLAAFVNANTLECKIDWIVNSIRNYIVDGISERYEIISNNILVNIIFSAAGTTGSAIYLDIITLLREYLNNADLIIGYILLPDIFVGKPGTRRVQPNAYATLKEISYFMREGEYTYKLGGKLRTLDTMFNKIYLVNNIGKNGIKYDKINDLTELLGLGMYLQSSYIWRGLSVANYVRRFPTGVDWYGKPTVFSSFGISELVYRSDRFAELYIKELALNVLRNTFLGGDLTGIAEFTDNYIETIGIKEHLADDVIDSILEPNSYTKYPKPKEPKKDLLKEMIQRKASHLNSDRKQLKSKANSNYKKFEKEKVDAINQKIAALLEKPQKLDYTKNFLNTLLGRIKEFRKEMEEERDDFKLQKENISRSYDSVENEAKSVYKKIIGAKHKVESVMKKYKAIVDCETSFIFEIERREKAITFFSTLINLILERVGKLSNFTTYFDVFTQEFSQEIQAKQNENQEIKPFVIELKPDKSISDFSQVQADDFLKWLNKEKNLRVADLINFRPDDVKNILFEFASSQRAVKEIREMSLEDILRDMKPEERDRIIVELDKMAAPLWLYDKKYCTENKTTDSIYLLGVNNPEDTIFDENTLQSKLGCIQPPPIVGTGDPFRIIFFKVETALPAFMVKNMVAYREKYLDANNPYSYHIHKDWENSLPELFPNEENKENRKYWSLGLAEPFKQIFKKGAYYYIISEKYGKKVNDYKVKLGMGRLEAFEAFIDNTDYVEEIDKNIEEIAQKLGNEKVIAILKTYGEKFLKGIRKQKDNEIKKLIEAEINDIEDYINKCNLKNEDN